ncbi:variable large family protein (plasmid) [Borrelia coriaceae]|uniref:Variable large protein n=1 Tax=Borrelia coriaceae ATCC 43381 TaxID=1408429 RepID=W5SX33_9SPIR|nr:variable large family protein [Borrelia coriaceae]AHH11460.1 Variable outer membrane protein [Borrelia coriaceae ATCC 43381]UPA17290.1 variable large family protein [Borrelia coriaceae]
MKINIKNIRLKNICAILFISLFLSCNNGIEELGERNNFLSSLASLGNDFLSVFTSFGDSLGGVLAFKPDTAKKSDVADYFKNIHNAVKDTKDKLNTIVDNMKAKDNPNAEAVKTKVDELIKAKLDRIIEGANEALKGTGGSEFIGNVAIQEKGGAAGDIVSLVNGIKSIVDIVLKNNEGKHNAGDGKKASGNVEERVGKSANDEAGKLFDDSGTNSGIGSTTHDAKKVAADAAKAVGAVTGADILKAMVEKNGDVTGAGAKDATIAGAIALRAMIRDGKFPGVASRASSDNTDYTAIMKGVAVSAVNKALNTLTIAIRKTIDEGLKTVKYAMNINANVTPVTTESAVTAK